MQKRPYVAATHDKHSCQKIRYTFRLMTRFCLTAILISAFILLPSVSFAQESVSHSSSEPAIVTEDREFRLRGFADSIDAGKTADEQFAERRAAYLKKRADARSACRDDIRRSNKATLVKTLLQCYRAELVSLKDFLAQQKETVQNTAGLIPVVRSAALTRISALDDAARAIIFAIDSGVYGSKDDILEAKQNLYKKYEVPLADAWLTVRGDRTLTWIAFMLTRLDQLIAQEHAVNLNRSGLTDARACVVTQETALRPLLKTETADRGQKLGPVLREMQICVTKIQGISRALNGSGAIIQP